MADIKTVQLSLDMYYDANNKYPTQAMAGDLSGIAGDLATYMSDGKLPCDLSIYLSRKMHRKRWKWPCLLQH